MDKTTGIQSHSQESHELLIFSVYNNKANGCLNRDNHNTIVKELEGHVEREVDGFYELHYEQSIVVRNTPYMLDTVEALCKAYNQECYMLLSKNIGHGHRKAYLCYPNGNRELIGYWKSCNAEDIKGLTAYTYSSELGCYWHVADRRWSWSTMDYNEEEAFYGNT